MSNKGPEIPREGAFDEGDHPRIELKKVVEKEVVPESLEKLLTTLKEVDGVKEAHDRLIHEAFEDAGGLQKWLLGGTVPTSELTRDIGQTLRNTGFAREVSADPHAYCFSERDYGDYTKWMNQVEEGLGLTVEENLDQIIALQTRLQQLFYIRKEHWTPVEDASHITEAISSEVPLVKSVLVHGLNGLIHRGLLPKAVLFDRRTDHPEEDLYVEELADWLLQGKEDTDRNTLEEYVGFLPDAPEGQIERAFPQNATLDENIPVEFRLAELLKTSKISRKQVGRLFLLREMLQ
jgi:hypothetical protein